MQRRTRMGKVGVAAVALATAMILTAAAPVHSATEVEVIEGVTTDFGSQLANLSVGQAIAGVGPGGRPALYTLQQGTPGAVGVVDPVSKELLASIPLSGAGGWGLGQAPDGGPVYVGTYNDARLWTIDPETFQATDLGAPVANEIQLYSLSVTVDGQVFGGTYPNGHLWSYTPGVGFRDYGKMHADGTYVRGVVVDDDGTTVWAGVGLKSHLMKVDVDTGAKQDVWPVNLQGNADSPYDVTYASGRVFVKTSDFHLVVLDADTNAVVYSDFTASSITSRGTTSLSPDGSAVYFNRFVTGSGVQFWRYDLATDTVAAVTDGNGSPLIPAPRLGMIGSGWIDGILYSKAGNYDGTVFWFDPATNTTGRDILPIPPQPLPLQSVSIGPDGKVYTAGFINGTLTSLDPTTELTTSIGRFGQAESWLWHDGIAYIGTYPTAGLLKYDPTLAYADGTNPRTVLSLQASHGQSRIVASAASGDSIFLGSTPDYGLHGGALTTLDATTGTFTVQKNIIPSQGIVALTEHDGQIWGGSAIHGGGATTPPVATEAVLFKVDPATGLKVDEFAPVAGANKITALATGPDGLLWGLADSRLFRFDSSTETVVSVTQLPPGTGHTNYDKILINPDGGVYLSASRQLIRMDAVTLDYEVINASLGRVSGLAQDASGDLWFVSGVNDTRLYRYSPPQASSINAPVNLVAPKLEGGTEVGDLLVAGPGAWDMEDLAFDYSWAADGEVIFGATNPNLQIDSTLNGKVISVSVTARAVGAPETTASSAPYQVAHTPDWDPLATYARGDVVLYAGKIHVAEWYAHGDQPGNSNGPWGARGEERATEHGTLREWSESWVYTSGQMVIYDGESYQSQWWNRNQRPGDGSSVWKKLS